jgi:hypothetical protein
MTGKASGTAEERSVAVLKLKTFQAKVIDPMYMLAVDSLIPEAEKKAEIAVATGENFDKAYHREMMRLTREAGLRR